VVSSMGEFPLQLSLLIANSKSNRFNLRQSMQISVDVISEVMDFMVDFSTNATLQGKYIVLTYLWTTWQGSIILSFHYALAGQLVWGYDRQWSDKLALRENSVFGHPSVRATLHGMRSSYLRSWAFEMLRKDRSALGLDSRAIHRRFSAADSERPARFLHASDEPCDGGHPLARTGFVHRRLVAEE